jgi:hypothetical protein
MNTERKELIAQLRSGVRPMTYRMIGEMLGVSGQRVQQIHTGYRSHSKWKPKPKPPEEHKILTRAKLLSMGFPANVPNTTKSGGLDYVREWVRIRDNHTCQMCFKVWKEGERRLDVHHTDEDLEGRSKERGIAALDRANMDKMITLCHKCHFSLDSVRRSISKGSKAIDF